MEKLFKMMLSVCGVVLVLFVVLNFTKSYIDSPVAMQDTLVEIQEIMPRGELHI